MTAPDVSPVWRPAKRIQPGWFVRMEGDWHEVRLLMEFGGGPGRRAMRTVRIDTVDGYTSTCDASTEVATLTTREAKKAGLS